LAQKTPVASIRYTTAASKHVIVELKKADVTVDIHEGRANHG
jgi:hypothetical protein